MLYKVNFDNIGGFGFTSKKVMYEPGESVVVIFNAIMTDTSYSFNVNVDDYKVDRSKGSIVYISFTMPEHDVDVTYTCQNVMTYHPQGSGLSGMMGYTDGKDTAGAVNTDIPAPWICPSCNASNTGRFCTECGTPANTRG